MNRTWCYTHSLPCYSGSFFGATEWCSREEPLAEWEKELLNPIPTRVRADVTFTLESGDTLTFQDVNVDSISPVGANRGCIAVEFENDADRVVHVPWVRWWEISNEIVNA